MQTFVTAFDTMFGGFRERAEATYRLLQTPGTAFLVVAAPEPDALREASYFVERLAAERMPLAGLILNRVHVPAATQLSAARSLAAAETLENGNGSGTTAEAPRYALAAGVQASPANRNSASGSRRHQVVHVLLVTIASLLQQLAPGLHVGPPPQQRTPLPLGHSAPDTELDAVVQCVGQAFGSHLAAPADQLGPVLRCALDKKLVRVGSFAGGACGPVSDPHVPTPLDRRVLRT
jgi:hypothetical protein